MCSVLVSVLLFHSQFKEDLEGVWFAFNPCNPCVANRSVGKKQHTIGFHIDDSMSGHVDKKVNDEFLQWLNDKCRSHREVTATRGNKHDHLGMEIEFTKEGKVKTRMLEHVEKMIEEFLIKFETKGNVNGVGEMGEVYR